MHSPSTSATETPPGLKPEHIPAIRSHSGKAEVEILALVRIGVEKFILKNATVEEFFATLRAVTEKENVYSHQLTRSVFARIVREAIKKRNLKRPGQV